MMTTKTITTVGTAKMAMRKIIAHAANQDPGIDPTNGRQGVGGITKGGIAEMGGREVGMGGRITMTGMPTLQRMCLGMMMIRVMSTL